MAKEKNGNNLATKVKVISGIVVLLVVFAGLVTGFGNIGDNTEAFKTHKKVDAGRDEKAATERNKLENDGIEIKSDIKYIKEGMAEQKIVSKERYDEQKVMLKGISDEIKAIHRSP